MVIISNDLCNEFNSVITVIPMTRQMKKLELPTHIVVDGQSVVLVEQITTIDKSLLDNKIGEIGEDDMQTIENAIRNQLGMKGGSE